MTADTAAWGSAVGPGSELEALSVPALRAELAERDQAVAELEEEIACLARAPQDFEQRLKQLEKTFSNFGPNDTIKIRSPLLLNISKSMSVEQARLHNEAVMAHSKRDASNLREGEVSHDPHTHHSHEDFVLGRRCMYRDPVAAAQAQELYLHGPNRHPVITKLHYAGHCVHPREEVQPVFVGPGGLEERRPLGQQPRHGEFWLDAAVREREEAAAMGPPEAVLRAERLRAVPQSVFARDRSGVGEDVLPKDWLGEVRRMGVEM